MVPGQQYRQATHACDSCGFPLNQSVNNVCHGLQCHTNLMCVSTKIFLPDWCLKMVHVPPKDYVNLFNRKNDDTPTGPWGVAYFQIQPDAHLESFHPVYFWTFLFLFREDMSEVLAKDVSKSLRVHNLHPKSARQSNWLPWPMRQ